MKKRDVSHARADQFGFTLVELMVTVAIAAILMAVGAPQLRSFLLKQQVAADVNALTTALRQARSEALKRNGRVTVCALPSGTFDKNNPACAAANATDWSHGWMIFIDYATGSSNAFDKNADTLLRIDLRTRPALITYDRGILTYQANGMLLGAGNGTFNFSPSDTSDALCRSMSITRQSRISMQACTTTTNAQTGV